MEGGTYLFMHLSLSTLYEGCTGPWKQNSFAHPHDPQISEKAYFTSSIHEIDGGSTPYFDGLFPQSTFPGPAGWREASERPYSCDICSKRYSQRQGVSRHRRKAHNNPHPCCVLHCEFKWTRPDLYRAHLKNRHSDVNPDKVLGKPAGSRRRSTIIGRDLPQDFPCPPDRRSQAELRQHPMTSPLPPVAKVTHVPTLPMSPVGYNSQHECAEPAITTRKHEDGWGLDLFGATAPSAFLPTEERAQAVNDLDVSIHVDRI